MDTLLAFVPCVDDSFGTGCFSRHRDDEKVDGGAPLILAWMDVLARMRGVSSGGIVGRS